MTITKNLATIRTKLQTLAHKYHRDPTHIKLLAASKSQSLEKIQEAIQAGQHSFGENYLQEALTKISALNDEKIEWHFIGNIQSNKTKQIAENFHWVQSVSQIKIAKRLNEQRPASMSPLNVCIEVNLSHETSKSGLNTLDEVRNLATEIRNLPRLKLRGLMAIPAPKNIFEEQRAECKKLHDFFENLRLEGFDLDTLSMGMSEDLDAAIAEGSTMVRVGTAIFGKRQ